MGTSDRSSDTVATSLRRTFEDASKTFGATRQFKFMAWLLVFSLALTLGLLLWSAKRQDEIAITGSRDLAETAIRVQQNSIAKLSTDYTYWDAAYENLAANFNEDWYLTEFSDQPYLADTFGVNTSFLIGPENQIIRHLHNLERIEITPDLVLESHIEGGILEMIAEARQPIDGEFEARSGLVKMQGQIYLTAVRVIHPHTDEAFEKAKVTAENAYLNINMRPLDDDLFAQMADDFGLRNFALVEDVNVRAGVTLPILSANGARFGTLVWQIDRPSSYVLQVVLPGLLLVIVFVGLLGWYVLNGLRRTQIALTQREAQFKQAHEISRLGYWQSANGEIIISPELATIFGVEPVQEYRLSEAEYYERFVHAEDRDRVRRETGHGLNPSERFESEYRMTDADGHEHWFREVGESVRDHTGAVIGNAGTVQDITERKQNEASLRQAQKMEAVGQLTGGLAHDFNNLLAVIMGMAELLQDRLGDEDKPLNAILQATTRGSDLTQRLLAFSRRQSLRPEALDLGALVSGMSDMLTRTLGATIEVKTEAAPDLWHAQADPGQVENTLLNLAINARDAMPDGGTLAITCANVHLDEAYAARNTDAVAGDYVVLTVSDTGTGISPEVLAQVFEPFFTTKDVGRGSGLGLSMVYGFAKQSGGHVAIDSDVGEGATIKLFLPRAKQAPQSDDRAAETETPRGGGESILVIEDDPQLREIVRTGLTGLGYKVFDFPDASGARALIQNGGVVDLLLSDVVLPGGTSGPEFAKELLDTHPDMKIIFMSGYPAEAIKANGFMGLDKVLLKKPFKRQELAKTLRETLD